MNSFQIKTGQISVNILDDDGEIRGVFRFNPSDVKVAKRFNEIKLEYVAKQKEYIERSALCTTDLEATSLVDEIVDYVKNSIDSAWGDGSCKILFGDASTIEMFSDFFTNIQPFYQEESAKRMKKYNK